tara:strand:- start:1395 stop:2156 length:762 start_codon:yes stop_codon:yes gene_type:complete
MNEDFKICIPSYKRKEFLKNTTAKLLEKHNLKYYVFVSTDNDFEEYSKEFERVVKIPTQYKGIGQVRHYIINRWAEDKEKIIMIDDDIKHLINIENKIVEDLPSFFNEFFDKLQETELFFGGVPLCNNTFFMKKNYSTNLKYISGALQFIIVDKSREEIETTYRHFEDYVYNIKYFKRDGGALRCNYISPITKNYNIEGGICAEYGSLAERLKDADIVADEICDEFKGYVSKYYKKKGRSPACVNLRLNHNKK